MRLLKVTLIAGIALLLFGQAESTLQRAIRKETIEGDLKGAIELYRQTVREAAKDRKTAAEALVHMGQCYEKLGDAESRKAYERIVREYADQKEIAAFAMTRLAGTAAKAEAGMTARQVWTGPKVDPGGGVSRDGQSLSFTDWGSGNLAIHDLLSGTDRNLTTKDASDSASFPESSIISPDGSQVAYSWFNGYGYDLRTIRSNPSSGTMPRILYHNDDIDWIEPSDWSPDGKWIAVSLLRKDGSVQIGLVAAEGGALRILKSMEWSATGKLAFSPDSRFVAYDRSTSSDIELRDVFVLAVDGSREFPTVVHQAMDTVVGWSPDGKTLLFASDRTGTTALWSLPIRDGKPQGGPKLVKSDIGRLHPLGVTRSGALYYGLRVGNPDIYIASIDFHSGKLQSAPTAAVEQLIGLNTQPAWSPDGKEMAYVTLGQAGRANVLSIQSIETGKVRRIHPMMGYFQWPHWSPDGTAFLVKGSNFKGRNGIYRIDARSGGADFLFPNDTEAQWSADGKSVYFVRQGRDPQSDAFVIARDIVSGAERELFRKSGIMWQSLSVSPDGRFLGCIVADPVAKESMLTLVPVIGGEARVLFRNPAPAGSRFTAWSPDGQSILLSGGKDIWMVSVSDGRAQKADDLGFNDIRRMRVQPAGNMLVFLTPTANAAEVWALENFLPAAKSTAADPQRKPNGIRN